MGTKPPLQEGDKLLARTPVSLTNTFATTANGGQDCIHNALTQENRENSKRTIAAPRAIKKQLKSQGSTHRKLFRKHA